MPLVQRILVTLRTLMEDEPQPSNSKKRRSNPSGRNNNRSRQTTAIIITFRDLFRSGGLDIILDEMDSNRRPNRRCSGRISSTHNRRNDCASKDILCTTSQPRCTLDSQVAIGNQKLPILTTYKPNYEDETVPLLLEESTVVSCRDLVVVSPNPFIPRGLFGDVSIPSIRNKKQKTVPLNPEDENKTVETLRKVLKWSPRKQQSAAFAVSLPVEDEHVALAVVENAVNRVKEEQLRKKKRKFLWLKFC